MTNPSVAYYEIAGAEGKFFRCDRYRCSLSTKACAKRWNTSQRATGQDADRFEKCRGCMLGSLHAGRPPVHYSVIYGLGICPRCRRGGARMIVRDCVCISDFNRAREVRVGANSKGTPPRKCHLAAHRLTAVVDDLPLDIRNPEAAGTLELVLGMLSYLPGRMFFTRARPNAVGVSVQELARQARAEKEAERRGTQPAARTAHAIEAAASARRAQSVDRPVAAGAANIERRSAAIARTAWDSAWEARAV